VFAERAFSFENAKLKILENAKIKKFLKMQKVFLSTGVKQWNCREFGATGSISRKVRLVENLITDFAVQT
jgi:hypothetical protein